jgi:hypothetical protein
MIKLKTTEGKIFYCEREDFEEVLTEGAIVKLNESLNNMGPMKGTVKSTLNMLLPMLGIRKPKEFESMETLEFVTRLLIETALSNLEDKEIEVPLKELENNDEL